MASNIGDTLEKVRAFVYEAHGDQMRKYASERYVAHLERVMETCREYTSDLSILSAALLHDVLEDTPVTATGLGDFLAGIMPSGQASKTLGLVRELTDVYIKADYPAMNRRSRRTKEAERLSKASPEAQTIKYADILDNVTDIGRAETDFALVFMRECKEILRNATRGDRRLYEKAVEAVDDGLQQYFSRANIKAL